jgi:general secretion pathway protein E
MGIYEILLLDDELRNLVMTRTDSTTIKQRAIERGMRVLREDGARKVLQGLTTTEEVLRVTQEEVV